MSPCHVICQCVEAAIACILSLDMHFWLLVQLPQASVAAGSIAAENVAVIGAYL